MKLLIYVALSGKRGPGGSTKMEVAVRNKNGVCVLDLSGKIDMYNASDLKEYALRQTANESQLVIFNLDRVETIDSSGIGALVYVCNMMQKLGTNLVITNLHENVLRVFRFTGLVHYFPIANTVDEALRMAV